MPMINSALIWNVRGIVNKATVRSLAQIIEAQKICLVPVSEPALISIMLIRWLVALNSILFWVIMVLTQTYGYSIAIIYALMLFNCIRNTLLLA